MDWSDWLTALGLPVPHSPDFTSIALAVGLLAASWWLGWLAARKLAPRLVLLGRRWAGRSEEWDPAGARSLTRYATTALLLLIVSVAAHLSPIGDFVLALGLGVAIALLVQRLARALGLATLFATGLAVVALVAATAGSLGGMRPLLASLDGVGVTIGKRHVTLLDGIDYLVIIAVLYALARLANRIATHSIETACRLDVSQQALAQKLASIMIVLAAIFLGIDLLGIDLTALTVFSGAFGLAVGFGLQKTFGNLIAGLILLMDRSVKPGDVIVVGDTFGQVTRIGVRAVSVVTRDGKEHLLPNEQLMTNEVENWSYSSRNVRIHISVGVGYGSDLALAQRLMIEAASASPRALASPPPSVWLTGFGDSSVDHDILVWIADPEAGVGNVRSDVLNRLWQLFADNGIELPFPQRDVHVRSLPVPPPADGDDRNGGPAGPAGPAG